MKVDNLHKCDIKEFLIALLKEQQLFEVISKKKSAITKLSFNNISSSPIVSPNRIESNRVVRELFSFIFHFI
jgi:hypothetical protein